jgi:hypothetical protein
MLPPHPKAPKIFSAKTAPHFYKGRLISHKRCQFKILATLCHFFPPSRQKGIEIYISDAEKKEAAASFDDIEID